MQILTEYEAEHFLEQEGFPIVNRTLCKSEKEALATLKKYDRVVLKLASPELLHKTEHGAVKINVTEKNFHSQYQELININVKQQGVIVQEYVEGMYFLLGIKKEAVFGHVLLFGLGGIYTEAFKDVTMRILPIEKKEIKTMINELQASELFHSREKLNVALLEKVLFQLSTLVEKYPHIQELDINPLILNKDEAT